MNFPEREEGQGLVEYALILVLVAIVVIAILTILGPQVVLVFARVAGGLRGDFIDVANNDMAVVVGFTSNPGCTQLTNFRFVKVDNNGQIITNSNVSAQLLEDGVPSGNLLGAADNTGIVTVGGTISVGSCNVTMR